VKQRNAWTERGQGLVEYALILVLIAVVVIGALGSLGGGIGTVFGGVTESITAPTATP
jgi:pilus assembly protein Flp/PilA